MQKFLQIVFNKHIKAPFLVFNCILAVILSYMATFLLQPPASAHLPMFFLFIFIFFYIYIINIFIYWLFYKNIKTFKITSYFLMVFSFIATYFSYKFSNSFDISFIKGIIMAEAHVDDVVSLKDILYIFLFCFLSLMLFLKIKIVKRSQFKAKLISIFVIIVLLLIYFLPRIDKNFDSGARIMLGKSDNSIIAMNTYLFNTIYYLNFYTILQDAIISYFSEPNEFIYTKKDLYNTINNKNIKTILFLSDTIRAKNLSIFGYKKPTTVELQKLLKQEKGQIFAVQSKACYTSSYTSINCILSFINSEETRENIEATINTKHKVQNYANILNYNTSFVRAANTGEYNLKDGFKEVISDVHTSGATDYKIVPLFLKSINKNKKQFIFGYVRGAHLKYNEFMEKQFEKFPYPTIDNRSAYDNKLVELDHTWSSIIRGVKNNSDPIFMIFTSDHGESLGEVYNGKKFVLHSAEYEIAPPEQLYVPFIVYVNDKYKKIYPEKVDIIAKNLKKYQSGEFKIPSDVVSHSLLHCSGAGGNWINEELSICSIKFKQ